MDHDSSKETPAALAVKDYAWGCVVTGTRIQIIAAALVPLAQWPEFAPGQSTWRLRLSLGGRSREVTIERDYCPTDTKPGEVWIRYAPEELNRSDALDAAIAEIERLQARVIELIAQTKPIALSRLLGLREAAQR